MTNFEKRNEGALWWRVAKKTGINYLSGKITVEEKDYYISVFSNKKKNEKEPDYRIVFNEQVVQAPKEDKEDDTQVYADFGSNVEMSDDELPF